MKTKYYLTGVNRKTGKREIIHLAKYGSDNKAKDVLEHLQRRLQTNINQNHEDFEITKVIKSF